MPRDKKSPAFQFYPSDYLSDEHVAVMDLDAQGVYVRLLSHCWIQGSLPGNPEHLRRLATCGSDRWPEIWPQVAPCFRSNGKGRLNHPRLQREKAKQREWKAKSKEGGIASAKSRISNNLRKGGSTKPQPGGARVVQPKGNSSSSSSSSSFTTTKKNQKRDIGQTEFDCQFWPAWPKKVAKKAALTAYLSGRKNGMPPIGELLESIQRHRTGQQWLDGFVPHAATWIRGERWSDEVEMSRPPAGYDPNAGTAKPHKGPPVVKIGWENL